MDKKLKIAIVVIAVLAVALIYVTIAQPKIQGYFLNKQIETQTNTVKAIISIVDQQGFITITDSDANRTITLVDIEKLNAQSAQKK